MPAPRPFTDFPLLAARFVPQLRWFREVGLSLEKGRRSLRSVCKDLLARMDSGELPPDRCPAITSICQLRNRLSPLLRQAFGRDIELYVNPCQDGGPVFGLSDDGREALRLTIEYLDELDRQSGQYEARA